MSKKNHIRVQDKVSDRSFIPSIAALKTKCHILHTLLRKIVVNILYGSQVGSRLGKILGNRSAVL